MLKNLISIILLLSIYVSAQEKSQDGVSNEEPAIKKTNEESTIINKGFYLSAFLMFNSKMKFDNVKMKQSGQNYSGIGLEYEISNSYLLNVGYTKQNLFKLGFDANLLYFPDLNSNSYTITYQGATTSIPNDGNSNGKFSGLIFEFLGNYRIDKILFLLGVNYPNYNYTVASGYNGKTTVSSNLGYTLGLKFFAESYLSIDFFVRSFGIQLSSKSNDGLTTLDTGYGYLTSSNLGLSYYF